jgi:hypothetical protein
MDIPTAKDETAQLVYGLPDDVTEFIVTQGAERLRAQQIGVHALDQRITQVAGFQFAAAALAGAVASVGAPVALIAAAAAVSFVIGGVVAFRGIRSDPHYPPGLPPLWWKPAADLSEFDVHTARSWLAGYIQDSLVANDAEDAKRAQHLNVSLRYGIAGAVLVSLAALLRAFA